MSEAIEGNTAELVKELTTGALTVKHPQGYKPFVLIPEGYYAKQLEEDHNAPIPSYIIASVEMTEMESFVRYVNRFKSGLTQIFATKWEGGAAFHAIIDYHDREDPHRRRHGVTFLTKHSVDFVAWRDVDGKPQSQEQFLDFVRKWGDAICGLTDADLLEMASSLDFTTKGQVSASVERVKGGRKLLVNETIDGVAKLQGKAVTVPDHFEIQIPVFEGDVLWDLKCDLLYRVRNGALTITIELQRPHLVVKESIEAMVKQVNEETEIQPYFGHA